MEYKAIIEKLSGEIVEACKTISCKPIKIVLISHKCNPKNELTSFKLCIVIEDVPNTAEFEGELYLKIDCDVPFDLILYNLSEWSRLIKDNSTFAAKINNSGEVIYG